MSILNSVMNVFKLTGEDDYDEYDDYDEEFEDDEDDKGSARKKLSVLNPWKIPVRLQTLF